MGFAARMDGFGKVAWLGLTLFAAWLYWPLALAVLLFLVGTGRLQNLRALRRGRWQNVAGCRWNAPFRAASGNAAFDDYRDDTIRRLEEEQREFAAYLERLRRARDKSEFDDFMAERQARRMPDAGAG